MEAIQSNPIIGWRAVYFDILSVYLEEPERVLKAVEMFGEDVVFEAIIVTSLKSNIGRDPLNYVIAVARSMWKEQLQSDLTREKDAIRRERSKQRVQDANMELAEKIERARRINADNSV